MEWWHRINGGRGYVTRERSLLDNPFELDAFTERFETRVDGETFAEFLENLKRAGGADYPVIQYGVYRFFDPELKRVPLLVGTGFSAICPTDANLSFGSPVVSHKNAGRVAMGQLRAAMLGQCLRFKTPSLGLVTGDWTQAKRADRHALKARCELDLVTGNEVPSDMRGELLGLLNARKPIVGVLPKAPEKPTSEKKSWAGSIEPTVELPGGAKLSAPIRFGQSTEKRYTSGELISFEDEVDPIEVEFEESPAQIEDQRKDGTDD